jgi:sugar (pentulose or hexulose) kinase
LWNPRLRAAMFGLSLHHTRADLARAYLEGVFFEVKRCVEVLGESTPIASVRVGGPIVRFASSMQMLADILGIPVEEASEGSPAAVGAALRSARLASAWTSATCPVPRPARTVVPGAPMVERYRSIYPEYLAKAARCE